MVHNLERRGASQEITTSELAEQYAPLYRGIAAQDAAIALAQEPSLHDHALCVHLLSQRGIGSANSTLS